MTLTALDFPASPTVGQLYPDPPVTGQPQYSWNGSQWLSSKAAVTQIARTDALGWSGMQINGSMDVSQEYGATPVSGGTAFLGYVLDGWKLLVSTSTAAVSGGQYMFGPPGIPNSLISAISAAQAGGLTGSQYVFYQHFIEGYRIERLAWGSASAQPITIGFWTCHVKTGIYGGSVRNSAQDRCYAFNYTQAVSSVWQYNTVTIPGCTDGTWLLSNGIGINLSFAIASGPTLIAPAANTWYTAASYITGPGQVNGVDSTANAFRITGVVVLPGIEAPTAAQSPLIMRPYDQELLTCQRYFRSYGGNDPYETIGNGQCANATTAVISISFGPEMRARPTLPTPAFSFALHTAGTGIAPVTGYTLSTVSRTNATINCGVASGLVAGNATKLITNNDLNARLRLDARL